MITDSRRSALGRSGIVLGVTVLALAGAGCSRPSDDDGAASWVEPGWVAEFRQEMEQFQAELVSCFAEFGVTAVPSPHGSVETPVMSYPAPPGSMELIDAADEACFERHGVFPRWRQEADSDAYARMVDSRQCLIAHGHEIPDPPVEEIWVESGGEWNPHRQVLDAREAAGLSFDATLWVQMNEECPQPGPFVHGVIGLAPG